MPFHSPQGDPENDSHETTRTEDSLQFWHANKQTLSKLYNAAIDVLSVPASSAAVERIFSHGGIFMRPHRARLTDKLLSSLVYLKCNRLKNL